MFVTGGGTGRSMLAGLALIGGSALAAIAISQTKPFQNFASQSDSGFVRAAMSTLTSVAEQLPPAMLNVAQEVLFLPTLLVPDHTQPCMSTSLLLTAKILHLLYCRKQHQVARVSL